MQADRARRLMERRALGRGGPEVSVVGFGAWGIGGTMWIGAEDDESERALQRAFELGVTFVDTARAYGAGHSEVLVGRAVRTWPDVRIATKVPPKSGRWPATRETPVEEAFPGEWIRRCTEESLRALDVEALDLQQLHQWTDEWLEQGDWRETVADLKQEGKIRAFGVSINNHEPENAVALVESGLVDVVQVIYNVFDQSPEDRLFTATTAAGVGVIVRVPFDEGGLTGAVRPDSVFPEGDFRNQYFRDERRREVWDRVQALAADTGCEVADLPALALRFCLSDPAVSTVIPGMRSTRHVEGNVAAAALGPLSESELETLRRHRWVRNFYV